MMITVQKNKNEAFHFIHAPRCTRNVGFNPSVRTHNIRMSIQVDWLSN